MEWFHRTVHRRGALQRLKKFSYPICEYIKVKQGQMFVSFDQPLYYKARGIIECLKVTPQELKHVIIWLGGFHTLMSNLGSKI